MRLSFSSRFVGTVLLWCIGAWFLLSLVSNGRHVIGMLLLAVTLAAMARPGVDWLDRILPRALSIVSVFALATGAVVALFVIQTLDLGTQVDRLSEAIPARIQALEDSGLRDFLIEADVAERANDLLDGLPTQVLAGTDDGFAATQQGFELFLIIFLAIYALQSGGNLVRGLSRLLPTERQAQAVAALSESGRRAGRFLDRTLAGAIVGGVLGGGVAALLDLPGVVVLAVWIGAWSIVPMAGAIVGYAPVVLLAGGEGTGSIWLAVGAGFLWLMADSYLQRWATDSTVRPGPLLATIALAFGLQLGWLVGILISLFVMALFVALLDHVADASSTPASPAPASAAPASATPTPATSAPPATTSTLPDESTRSVGSPAGRGLGRVHLDRLDNRSAATAVGALVAVFIVLQVLSAAAPAPTWVVLGLTLAIGLHQVVDALVRHSPLSRRWAAWVVTIGSLCVIAAFGVLAVPSIVRNTVDLTADLPQLITDLGQLPLIGDWLGSSGWLGRLDDAISGLPDQLAADSSPIEAALISGSESLHATFWVLLVAATAIIDGPRLVRMALRNVPAGRRDQASEVLNLAYQSTGRYAAGSALVASMAGTFIFVASLVLGAPLAIVSAVWAALWNFVPQIGGYVGGAPFILFAFAQGGTTGIIALVAYLVYWQIENRLIQPIVISKAVDLSPFVAMAAVLFGAAMAGVAGAVLATPLVGAAKLISTELIDSRSAATDMASADDRGDVAGGAF